MANNRKRKRRGQLPPIGYDQPRRTAAERAAARRGSRLTRKTNDPRNLQPGQQIGPGGQLYRLPPAAHQLPAHAHLVQPGEYTTRGGRVVRSTFNQRGQQAQPAPVPLLPQLGPDGQLVYAPAPEQAPVKRPGEDAARAFHAARKWSWRYRWQLTPVAATAGTAIGAGVAPVATVLGLGAVAGAAALTAKKGPDEIHGRKWLSRAERVVTARWAVSAAVWTAGIGLANVAGLVWSAHSAMLAAAALGAMTGWPSVEWLKSRRIRREDKPADDRSEGARALMAAWPTAVAMAGPDELIGSRIVDVAEPDPGTIVADVELRDGVHAETVTGNKVRQWLERALGMGVGTAKVELNRDHAGRIRLVLTPSRHLEQVSKLWPGPVLHADGRAMVAITPDGRDVPLSLYGDDGIRHLMVIGSTGSGKTNAYNVLLLPLVLAGRSVLVYVDGKRGTSSPMLSVAIDHVALKPDEWADAIEMVHAIMCDREDRYGEMGLDKFDVNGPDPIIELVIDEGRTVARSLTDRQHELVGEISERGRALGVALRVGVQRPSAESVPGGIDVRDNLMGAAGNVIGLRPGGSVAKGLTLTSTSADIDLLSLPTGGGWCAVLREGELEAAKARILHIPDDAALVPHLQGFTPRTLTGDDATAAGEVYANRRTGKDWLRLIVKSRAKAGRDPGALADLLPAELPSAEAQPEHQAERLVDVDDGEHQAVPERVAPSTAESRAARRAVEAEHQAEAAADRAGGAAGIVRHSGRFVAGVRAATNGEALDRVRQAGDDGIRTAELVELLGVSKRTVTRRLSELVKAGQVVRSEDDGRYRAAPQQDEGAA